MITFLLGLPGSGKTAYAVDRIFNNFSEDVEAKKDKKVTFENCYTNINEFKFDKVTNTKFLDFDILYTILERLHSLYKKKKSDKYLVKFAQRVKIKNTLFVIDEAHNHFDRKDMVLVWWLSYHRHLYHEIILITQNIALIESKYKSFSEFFYVAKPQSLSLFKSHFKYNTFTHSRLSKASAVGSIKIKRNKKVFDLYHSGDSIDTKNLVLKYIIISIVIFFVLVAFFYSFISSKSVNDPIEKSVTLQQSNNVTQQDKKISADTPTVPTNEELKITDREYFILSCSFGKCSNDDISIPPQLLRVFIDDLSVKILFREDINNNLSVYHLDCSKDFYNYLLPTQKGDFKDEDSKKNNSLSVDSIFSSGGK